MLTVALTGGIASGKTLVSDQFATLGVPIVDTDLLARQVVEPGTDGLRALVAEFGPAVLEPSGSLNRSALRERVFKESDAREKLNGILHPLIRELANQHMATHEAKGHAYAVQVIPLLVETGQHERFDRVLLVDVARSVQLERLMQRDGSSQQDAEAVLNAQASREERLAISDDVIVNDGEPKHIVDDVRRLHEIYSALAASDSS